MRGLACSAAAALSSPAAPRGGDACTQQPSCQPRPHTCRRRHCNGHCAAAHCFPHSPQAAALVASVDEDGSGCLEFNEFLQVVAAPQRPPYSQAELLRAFRRFADKGAPPGCIAPETLEKALVRARAAAARLLLACMRCPVWCVAAEPLLPQLKPFQSAAGVRGCQWRRAGGGQPHGALAGDQRGGLGLLSRSGGAAVQWRGRRRQRRALRGSETLRSLRSRRPARTPPQWRATYGIGNPLATHCNALGAAGEPFTTPAKRHEPSSCAVGGPWLALGLLWQRSVHLKELIGRAAALAAASSTTQA